MGPDDEPQLRRPAERSAGSQSGGFEALQAIHTVAQTLLRSLDFQTLADCAVDAIATYAPFGCASIYTVNEAEGQLELVSSIGFSEEIVREGRRLPLEGSLMGVALREARVLLSDDLAREGRGIEHMRQRLHREGFGKALIVPLIHGHRKLGSLNLVLQQGFEPTEQERDTLMSIGHSIALALQNARYVERIRRSELRYAMATAAGKVGVWDWDAESGSFYLDPNVKALLGYRDDEIPNDIDAWSEHVHPEDRERLSRAVASCLQRGGAEFVCERRMIHKDGSIRWIMARGNGVPNASGEIRRILATDVDITERKRLEEERSELQTQLLHAEKLKSLGILAGGIAHDFNNLLTGVLGNASLALERVSTDSPVRSRIEQIDSTARRAAELTRQLLAYSGKATFLTEQVDLSALVREMTELLRASISKKAKLEYELAPDLPVVEADVGQLRQVVMNLITNASEALDGGAGTIRVRTGQAGLTEREMQDMPGQQLADGRYVFFEVADDGRGMDEPARARIFDPFYTTKTDGRGLGLAAVQGIVRGHQGGVRVESEPGQGATVTVLFPAATRQKPAKRAEPPRPAAAEPDGGTVLVADDEDSVRTVARTILRDAGFTVLAARNGREAIDLFRERADEIRLVLLDLKMPGISGFEVHREIRKIRGDARVILSSGYAESDELRARAADGSIDFLQKPYSPDTLIEQVRKTLRR